MDEMTTPEGVTRRLALQRAGLVAGGVAAVWAAPAITTLGGGALAATGSQSPSTATYRLSDNFTGTAQPTGGFAFYESQGDIAGTQLTTPRTFVSDPGFSSGPFPLVVRNISSSTHSQGTYSNPPGGIVAHPGATSDVLLRFTTPNASALRVRVTLVDAEPAGGDGVTYMVYAGGVSLGGGTVGEGGSDSGTFVTAGVVPVGTPVDLVISRGADYSADGTRVTFAIDEI